MTNYQSSVNVYAADWVLPISSAPIEEGAVVVDGERIIAVGEQREIFQLFPNKNLREFGQAAILPGLVNAHTHLELTVLRGFLDSVENDFSAWLLKLAAARDHQMNRADIENSALCGAIEAARSGITCLGDIGKHAFAGAKALRKTGLRGISFQENSFAMNASRALEFFDEINEKIAFSRQFENERVKIGITPHAPYTVSAKLFELITDLALRENFPLTIHAAESEAEEDLMRHGTGNIANVLANLGVVWNAPNKSSVGYLHQLGVLKAKPLLAHCVNVDERDIEVIAETKTKVAHCPKSNAKFAHGIAPFAKFLNHHLKVGLGSDSVASNNTCDLLEEARFAALLQRTQRNFVGAAEVLRAATLGGAAALGLENEIGALEAGKQADLCVISLGALSQQPIFDVNAALVFSTSANAVVLTMVAGENIYENGEMKFVDEAAARARLRETKRKLSD